LHNNDKILQKVVSSPPSGGSIIIRRLNPLQTEVKNEVETSEKIWSYVAREGKFENRGQDPLGPQKGLKKFENFLEGYRKMYPYTFSDVLTTFLTPSSGD